MKQKDFFFLLIVAALFLPFCLSETLYRSYQSFNAAHGMVMSFLKFGILSTLGELLGLRISTGSYLKPGFGLWPPCRGVGHLRHGHQHGFCGILHRRARLCRLPGRGASGRIDGRPPHDGKGAAGFGHFRHDEHYLRPCLHDPAQDYGHAHPGHGRHPARLVHPDTDGRYHAGDELARTVELRLQEDHPLLLVSGAYHHLPPARGDTCALRRIAGRGIGSDIGGGSAEEVKDSPHSFLSK